MRRSASSISASGSLMGNGGVRAGAQHVDSRRRAARRRRWQAGVLRAGQPRRAAGRWHATTNSWPHLAAPPRAPRAPRPVEHDLGDAVAVAQVEEDQLAEVAPAVDPAGQGQARPTSSARASPQVAVRWNVCMGAAYGTGGGGNAPAAVSRGGGRPVRGSAHGPGRRHWPMCCVPACRSRTWTWPLRQLVAHDDREVGPVAGGALELPPQLARGEVGADRQAGRAQFGRQPQPRRRVLGVGAHDDGRRPDRGRRGLALLAPGRARRGRGPRAKPMPGVGLPPSSSTSPS